MRVKVRRLLPGETMTSLSLPAAAFALLAGLASATTVAGCSGAGTSPSGADGTTPSPASSSSASRDAGADSRPSDVPAPSFCARAAGPLFCADFDGADATGGFSFSVSNPSQAGARRPTVGATSALAASPPRSLRATVPESELQADAVKLVTIGDARRVTVTFALRPLVGKAYATMARVGFNGHGPPQRIDLFRGFAGYQLLVEGWTATGDVVPLTVPIRDDVWTAIRLELDLTERVARLFVDGVPATPEFPGLLRREVFEDTLQLSFGLASIGGGAQTSIEAAFDDVLVTAP